MEYSVSSIFNIIEIKKIDVSIHIYRLARNADIHIRYVTEGFIKEIKDKLGLDLKPKTIGSKKYYVLPVDGAETNITFWVE